VSSNGAELDTSRVAGRSVPLRNVYVTAARAAGGAGEGVVWPDRSDGVTPGEGSEPETLRGAPARADGAVG
jgi:hypothetical protein